MWTIARPVCSGRRCDVPRTAWDPRARDVGSTIVNSTREPLAERKDAPHAALRTLVGRRPSVPADRLLAELVPPRHFADASFDSYVPDAAHPSQAAAVARLRKAADQITNGPGGGFWRRRSTPVAVYLDGGFGVGKTH